MPRILTEFAECDSIIYCIKMDYCVSNLIQYTIFRQPWQECCANFAENFFGNYLFCTTNFAVPFLGEDVWGRAVNFIAFSQTGLYRHFRAAAADRKALEARRYSSGMRGAVVNAAQIR